MRDFVLNDIIVFRTSQSTYIYGKVTLVTDTHIYLQWDERSDGNYTVIQFSSPVLYSPYELQVLRNSSLMDMLL